MAATSSQSHSSCQSQDATAKVRSKSFTDYSCSCRSLRQRLGLRIARRVGIFARERGLEGEHVLDSETLIGYC